MSPIAVSDIEHAIAGLALFEQNCPLVICLLGHRCTLQKFLLQELNLCSLKRKPIWTTYATVM